MDPVNFPARRRSPGNVDTNFPQPTMQGQASPRRNTFSFIVSYVGPAVKQIPLFARTVWSSPSLHPVQVLGPVQGKELAQRGGRWGSSKGDFNEIRHRPDVIGAVKRRRAHRLEWRCGCGVRF